MTKAKDVIAVRVSRATHKKLADYAASKGVLVFDAAEALLATGFSRIDALRTYAEKRAAKNAKAVAE